MTTAQTTSGIVRGREKRGVHSFHHVPFAAAPIGPLRFKAPVAPEPWSGERDGTEFGPVCLQQSMGGIFGELGTPKTPPGEDCLNVNVWTPDPGGRLPVLVWIHGGAFYAGTGSDAVYDGSSFAANGVVVVTINYRLGAQGYLHLADHFPDLPDSGNAGTLDQIAALKWVQQNIAAFGGDPGKVTIAGESAGGMSVSTLLAAPQAKGLFRAAIPQSGAGHNSISAETASRLAGFLLEKLGVKPGDTAALEAVTPQQLLEAQIALGEQCTMSQDVARFGEVTGSAMWLEPTHGTEVLPQRPIEAIAAGKAADIAVMIGTTTEEAMIFLTDMQDVFTPELVQAGVDAVMAPAGKSGADATAVYQETRSGLSSLELAAAFQTDMMFRIPALRLADAQAAHNPNTWLYEFGWRSTVDGGRYGACHALEIPFAFHTIDAEMAQGLAGDPPVKLADTMHATWLAFIKNGDPNHAQLADWEAWHPERRPTLRFDLESKLLFDPAPEERALWDGVI